MSTPDLNMPDFSTLTVSRMLQQTDDAIDELPDEPLVLIGSSLGGFVAIQAAAGRPERVHRLVLLAPAIDFGATRMRQLGNVGLAEWKRAGRMNVFHYGYGRMMPVHYELYEDASHYSADDAYLPQPVLVFQGRHDDRGRSGNGDSVVQPTSERRAAHARRRSSAGGEPASHLGRDPEVAGPGRRRPSACYQQIPR